MKQYCIRVTANYPNGTAIVVYYQGGDQLVPSFSGRQEEARLFASRDDAEKVIGTLRAGGDNRIFEIAEAAR